MAKKKNKEALEDVKGWFSWAQTLASKRLVVFGIVTLFSWTVIEGAQTGAESVAEAAVYILGACAAVYIGTEAWFRVAQSNRSKEDENDG